MTRFRGPRFDSPPIILGRFTQALHSRTHKGGGLAGAPKCRVEKFGTNPSDFCDGFRRYWGGTGVKIGTVFLKKLGSDFVVQSSR